jgi:hypothetical protein
MIDPAVEARYNAALTGSTGLLAVPPPPAEDPAPESTERPVSQVPTAPAVDPTVVVGGVKLQKMYHGKLILQGVCSHCAHCGQALTDSESVERGIGPVCSRKGYFEDPKDSDEMQAMIDLAEYPQLVEFLVEHYKPQGIRGMVNGLVRVCSLNRRSPVHQACTDAIQSLGYEKLASLLRESLAVVEIKESKKFPGSIEVWCKKDEWKFRFTNALRYQLGGHFERDLKATVVPVTKDVDGVTTSLMIYSPSAKGQVTHRRYIWNLLLAHYEGFYVKVVKGDTKTCTKITTKTITKVKSVPPPAS